MGRAQELVDYLASVDSLAIVCHDNPDPDCIASALALVAIADFAGVETSDVLYGGDISHQQNRAFVNLLDVPMERLVNVDLHDYEGMAFVDHAVPGGHVELGPEVVPDVVVDHHPSEEQVDTTFVDVRESVGATTTIFVGYLEELGIDPDARLASALLFALHRERIDYLRHPTVNEYEAALSVYPNADIDLLDQLYGASFTPSTVDAIAEGIRNRTQRGASLTSCIGRTSERDALVQVADYLQNIEGVDTVLVFGIVNDAVEMSARSIDPRVDVGDVLVEAFGDVGSAGGHTDMAGASIPLGLFADVDADVDELVEFVSRRVSNRFFDALNLEKE
ncbi:DHH family phosphoesterase [Halomicrococcus sp. SG-WS-1]|uniref:DHH family phosphoesterase n=1 Tax=Halomicrococcus sp. SG-WS-1 TaxID=3439057 RepID=UPI003F7A73AC